VLLLWAGYQLGKHDDDRWYSQRPKSSTPLTMMEMSMPLNEFG
jgi:hypothetical protein